MRAIGTITVLALVALVIGLFAGWFSVSKEATEDGTRFGIEVHEEKLELDVDRTEEALQGLGPKIDEALEGSTDAQEALEEQGFLVGTLRDVDLERQALILATVRADGEETVRLDPEARIEIEGSPAQLSELRPGDRVAVRFRSEGARDAVTLVLAERGSEG